MSIQLVGQKAPAFTAKALVADKIVDPFKLENLVGRYVVLFFYPLDFTFVCPTELHGFQERLELFKARGTEVVGCSVDSVFSHLAWSKLPKSEGGIAGISYPLLADLNQQIARAYHVLNEEEGVAFRGLFLIDQTGIIRHQLVNDLPLGRSIDEVIRMVDALTFFDTHGEVCPANWTPGKSAMTPTHEGLSAYFQQTP